MIKANPSPNGNGFAFILFGEIKSLNNFINDFSPSVAYKLIGSRNGKVGVKETLPHYCVMFL